MTTLLTLRSRTASGLFRIALMALPLALLTSAPARAGASVDACFNAVGDAAKASIDTAKQGADFVSNNCEQWTNPATAEMFAAAVGVVTVLDAAGAFGGGSCKDFVKTKIAAALVSALAGAVNGNNPLTALLNSLPDSDKVKAEVQQLANNISAAGSDQAAQAAAEEAYNILSGIPVLGQAIDMLPCACIAADAAIKAGDDLAQAASQTGQCGEFALACVSGPLSCAQSLFESGWEALKDFGDWVVGQLGAIWGDIKDAYCASFGKVCNAIPGLGKVCGCPDSPGPPNQINCVAGDTLSGDVHALGGGTMYSVSSNNACNCPATMAWKNNGGIWSCGCPDGQVPVAGAPGICECPGGQGLLKGSCQSCPASTIAKGGICQCKIAGQTYGLFGCSCPTNQTQAGDRCYATCPDPKQILMKNGVCCGIGQLTSCGVCCPDGQKPDPNSGSCVAPANKP